MFTRSPLGILLIALLPNSAATQEAFLQQVSLEVPTIELTAPSVQLDTAGITGALGFSPPTYSVFDINMSPYPVIASPTVGSVALSTSVGDNNTAIILQISTQAASILQIGDHNTALLRQTGTGNRASVYQTLSASNVLVSQVGANNTALSIQR